MKTSYKKEDVLLLLKDLTGKISPQDASTRERHIQGGGHYSEMLPLEYTPSKKYFEAYQEALSQFGQKTADAVCLLSEKIYKKNPLPTLVSLARAGTPAGILVKRYLFKKYGISCPHYSISIIRDRGIDNNAMKYILSKHPKESLVFLDGWTGKGAILRELQKALQEYPGVSSELAVLADPANITSLCGTHEDILIPSSCLNATVSGLVSRTFLRRDLIGETDFHGAVYYEDLEKEDLSYDFIHEIEKRFSFEAETPKEKLKRNGLEECREIAKEFSVSDINLIKPGIGETTRVLLRRVPDFVLIGEGLRKETELSHILQLAKEKDVPVKEYPLKTYKTCGIIKNLSDI